MMTVQDLIDSCNGMYLSVDGADAGECTAVPHLWQKLLGLPLVLGNAVDTFANADPAVYEKTLNSPTAIPKPGSILVWEENAEWQIGPDGHTAVFLGVGSANSFTSLDQNWPTGARCGLVHHADRGGLLGWFYPKVLDQSNQGEAVDLLTARRIAFWIYGLNGSYSPRNALNGDVDGQIIAWVGQDTNTVIQQCTDDQYGQAYKAYLGEQQSTIAELNQKVADLTQELEIAQQAQPIPVLVDPPVSPPSPSKPPVTSPPQVNTNKPNLWQRFLQWWEGSK